MINKLYRAVIAGVLLALSVPALGDTGDKVTMKINITGTVVATGSCTFNETGPLAVDFGIVEYGTGGGKNSLMEGYRKTLTSSMTCTGDTEGSAAMTLFSGSGSIVNYQGNKLLPVKNDDGGSQSQDLAIRLLVNSDVQDINTAFAVDMNDPPQLEAEVVQIGSGSSFVSGSTFSANATLTMAFN